MFNVQSATEVVMRARSQRSTVVIKHGCSYRRGTCIITLSSPQLPLSFAISLLPPFQVIGLRTSGLRRRTMAARFPRGKQPDFVRAWHWDKKVIFSSGCPDMTFAVDWTTIIYLSIFCVPPSEGVAYMTVFNFSATSAATFHLRGYKCLLVIFVFP